ncbi:F-box protein At3g08750-like [Humulus lupulus]|uniref:F-box protein At3g08750-like n=1 Tax=Humulus lupulus TaxID=3486 RepID=UPI002B40AA3B|nr:F-box protein At3g08750-like [Humulus lupulus]
MAEAVKFHNSIQPYLPEEIIEKILLRLPHESVITSKLVCKSWYTFIKSDYFVWNHLHHHHSPSHNTTTAKALILAQSPKIVSKLLKSLVIPVSWDDDNNDDQSDHIRVHNLEKLNVIPYPRLLLKGLHCNGVVCFSSRTIDQKIKIVFYNPTLRQCKILDIPLVPGFWFLTEGFGHDQRRNLYKYLRILQSKDLHSRTCRVLICTLSSSSSSWKEIDLDTKLYRDESMPHIYVPALHPDGVYLKSFYYWLTWADKINGKILSFDMWSEKFDLISLPFETQDEKYSISRLSVWKAEFLVLFMMKMDTLSTLEMWVLVSGVGWRKHLTIDTCYHAHPLGFWSHEELLIKSPNQHIVSYNIRTKKTRKLDIPKKLEVSSLRKFPKNPRNSKYWVRKVKASADQNNSEKEGRIKTVIIEVHHQDWGYIR